MVRRGLWIVVGLLALSSVLPGAASAAPSPWGFYAGCPVDNALMLASPAGDTTECADIDGPSNSSYNLGTKQFTGGPLMTMGFGVADVTSSSPGTVVPRTSGGFTACCSDNETGLIAPNAPDVCPLLFAGNPSLELNCEASLDSIGGRLAFETTTILVSIEPAGNPSGFHADGLSSLGRPVVTLPVKFHLQNHLLGKNCYVGTNQNPVVLHLTTVKTGTPGTPATDPNGYPVTFSGLGGGGVADSSFAEPGATGCGNASGVLDSTVNSTFGLPSPAGKNSFSAGISMSEAATQAGGSVLSQSYHAAFG